MTAALVIGGGLAGAGVATVLAQAGQDVRLFERETGPHDKVCGGFLSCEAVDALHRLGVDPLSLGAAPITRLRIHVGSRKVCDGALPFPALSLARRVLDEALLKRAAEAGARVERGVRVTRLAGQAGDWTLETSAGSARSPTVFLATGKRDLSGWKRPSGLQPDLIGFRLHFRLRPDAAKALMGAVELYMFPGGYAGLENVGGGWANLCLVVREHAYANICGAWPELLGYIRAHCPTLDARLDHAELQSDKPSAIAAIPYGYVCRQGGGVWRLGDQAAVIPSFAGEGMSIALQSAELAATFALAGASASAYQAALARRVSRRVLGASLLSQAMVRRPTQALIGGLLSVAPSLAGLVARHTRLQAV